MHQRDFEHLLPSSLRMRAARQAQGDLGWPSQDIETVVAKLTEAGLAITCMDVWGVAGNTTEELAAFSTSGSKIVAPEAKTIDGRIIWTTLIDAEGQPASFGFEDFRAAPDDVWDEFVQAMATFTLEAVHEVESAVAPAIADKLYFSLCVAKAPQNED